ncbi:MAG TPA: hypothetical protein VGQ62_22330 [Chloroflexota bacterium]|nr:hypothetical protein [Chloroflexota bacterium]
MAPRVGVEIGEVQASENAPGRWQITWVLTNQGAEPLHLESAWVPHGRFRGESRLAINRLLESAETCRLRLTVAAQEAPGTQTQNAFLILLTRVGEVRWRIFVRMSVDFDAQQTPRPRVESITLQASASSATPS